MVAYHTAGSPHPVRATLLLAPYDPSPGLQNEGALGGRPYAHDTWTVLPGNRRVGFRQAPRCAKLRGAGDSANLYGAWPFILTNSRTRPAWRDPGPFSNRMKYLTSGAYQY